MIKIIIMLSIAHYALNTYKQSCAFFAFNDYTPVVFLSFSSLTGAISINFYDYLWRNIDVRVYIWSLHLIQLANMIFALLGMINPYFFLFTCLISRMTNQALYVMADVICFGLYDPFRGLKYSGYMYISILISTFGENIFNFVFMRRERYLIAFWFLLAFSLSSFAFEYWVLPQNI